MTWTTSAIVTRVTYPAPPRPPPMNPPSSPPLVITKEEPSNLPIIIGVCAAVVGLTMMSAGVWMYMNRKTNTIFQPSTMSDISKKPAEAEMVSSTGKEKANV